MKDISTLRSKYAEVSKIAAKVDSQLMLFILLFAEIDNLRGKLAITNQELR